MLTSSLRRFYGYGLFLLLVGFYICYASLYYSIFAIPVILFGGCLFLLSLDKVLILIAFFTPFSVKILIGNSGINLINEPLMLLMLLLFLIKIYENLATLKPLLKEPLTLAIVFNLAWIFITTLTSTLPIISFKFLLARLWVVVFGFFWGSMLFKNPKKMKQFLFAFGLGLSLVVIYTFIRHFQHGFTQKSGTWVMNPFMDDHTVYGAVCSIVLTYSIILLLSKKSGISFSERLLAFYISGCALIGVIFSYSRAAWLSLVFVFIFFFLLKLKIKFQTLLISLLLILSVIFIYHDELYQHIRFNKSASGKNLQSDIQSISNVKTDVSNVERLNRWEAGWRMFQDKPFFGFGPGTYMFKYSPYQRAHEMTIISTTKGTMGGMHSEYFGPMVESGFIGLMSILFLFGIYIKTSMENYYKAFNRENKLLNLAILLGLLTYFFHGLMNNFLDQDKASVIFWALMGMCAALSIKRKETVNEISEKES